MSTLEIELNKSQRDFNAMLRFDTPVKGNDGTIRYHQEHVFWTTAPEMHSLFHESYDLNDFVKLHVNAEATNVVLFSRTGWDIRTKIKKETEDRIQKRSCSLCIMTCGLAICCCCCFGLFDLDPAILSEEKFFSQMREQYPDQTRPSSYFLVLVGDNGAVPFTAASPTAPVEPDTMR